MGIHILKHLPELTTPADAWPSNTSPQPSALHPAPKPPLVRHLERNVQLKFTPALRINFQPGTGDLYVAESQLIWHDPQTTTTICIDYRSIVIHAISRQGDPVANAPCIYCQLEGSSISNEGGVGLARDANGDLSNEEMDEAEEEETMEVRLVPVDVGSLDAIFQALSDCTALHPDPEEDEDEDMESNEWFTADSFRGDGTEEMSEFQEAIHSHLDTVFDRPPVSQSASDAAPRPTNGHTNGNSGSDQFADAEEQLQR
ncbi:hypothetical protein HK097_002742 [Rhizophlyctis rosea]|uniref:Methylosome subunit pICln n=1 Tax=Rhizophlyctis rosea TaxID=64517 RepID=A0AAD5WZZ7_9FUNG|nr:hypothetical protein HK097_002742 [Rhizophlyctis rosea]